MFHCSFIDIHVLITTTSLHLSILTISPYQAANHDSSSPGERAGPRSRQTGIYDRTNPNARPFRELRQPNPPTNSAVSTAASLSTSTPSRAPKDGPVATASRMSPPDRKEDGTQVPGSSLDITKGYDTQPLGLCLRPREVCTPAQEEQSTAQQSGTQALRLCLTPREGGTPTQRPHANVQRDSGRYAGRPAKLNEHQKSRLSKLGLTHGQAMRFACPWDMYLRCDSKKCTDISCPFNHTAAPNLERKPLMCPFWGGKGGRHARCTKPANECPLAHYECAHKQYGALPPGWVIRS